MPQINRKLVIRLGIVILATVFFCLIFRPCLIHGSSMEPTYHDRSMVLNFRWRYLFSSPKHGDVVTISYFGDRFLLKRVVAVAGDTVEFRQGKLVVNGVVQQESYVKNPCSWSIAPEKVQKGCCYVVGDNREQLSAEHRKGQVEVRKIKGGPLW